MGRLTLARAGAAVVGASITVLLAAAVPASAQTNASLDNRWENGLRVNLVGEKEPTETTLIGLGVDGRHLDTYCVELRVKVDRKHPDMVERKWGDYPDKKSPFYKNSSKVNWILNHSYPALPIEQVEKAVGKKFDRGLSKQEAIAATQASIWHFSDKVDLDKAKATDRPESNADVVALYEYLTGDKNVGIEEPRTVLEVSPDKKSGKAGERIGPFTVTSTADVVNVLAEFPKGVKLTDKDGKDLPKQEAERRIKELKSFEIYVDVPEDAKAGKGSITLSIEGQITTGRLFVGKNYEKHPTQTLIVAKSDKVKLTARAETEWAAKGSTAPSSSAPSSSSRPAPTSEAPETTTTPAPVGAAPEIDNTSGLASTGASIFVPVLIGVVLVGAGVGALLFQRRRKRA